MNIEKLKEVTDEALMVSMVKMLVFQKLIDKPGVSEYILKNKINHISNDRFMPGEDVLRKQEKFNFFIEKLSNFVLAELR
jgi:hypothetical protein